MKDVREKQFNDSTDALVVAYLQAGGEIHACPTAVGIPVNGIGADNRGIHQCRLAKKGK